mmetsp:Transcript_14209/g.20300  ORF Transcript_14209/g.20300 Transcript_14209/m.20300 type:complete len:404 (-) Transcript_14209:13-1224(-)
MKSSSKQRTKMMKKSHALLSNFSVFNIILLIQLFKLSNIFVCHGASVNLSGSGGFGGYTFQPRSILRRGNPFRKRYESRRSGQYDSPSQPPQFFPDDSDDKMDDDYNLQNEEDVREVGISGRRSVRAEFDRFLGARPWSVDTRPKRPGTLSLTSKLITANVAVFVLQMMFPGVTQLGIKRSELILQGKQLHRLVTPVFLHGSIMHLLMNTYSLRNIGPEVEGLFGKGRFLATYIAGGVFGNILSAYNSPNPSLGASGAVFGLMGAYYTFLSRNESLFGRSGQLQMESVTGTLAMNVIFGLMSPGIDNWGHIGGAIGGAAMATTFGPKLHLLILPNGGRMVVDKPLLRLPRSIESIPERMSKRLRIAKLRMQMNSYQSDLSVKPWRPNKTRMHRRRSMKPRFPE